MKRAILGVMCASALVGVGVGSCDDNNDVVATDTVGYDSYLYYGYYPADVYYSSYYWTDPYYYYYAAYGRPSTPPPPTTTTGAAGGTGTTTGAAGGTGTSTGGSGGGTGTTAAADMTMGDVLRAMARGESVCPNQVSITPKMTADACAMDGTGMSRSGVTITFNGCQVGNGSQFDGTIDVQGSRTLSDAACASGTMVTFTASTTITNLTRTTASGTKILIPNATGMATTSYVAGQLPTSVSMTVDGALQLVGPAGRLNANRMYSGNITLTPSADRSSYTSDGTLTLTSATEPGTTTLTSAGIARSDACCRPTGGTLTINQSGGTLSGTHTWTFGPSCGALMFDGASVTAPSCL